MTRKGLICAIGGALALVAASLAFAGAEGRIAGMVVDPDGNPVKDVQVTIRAVEVEMERSAVTDKKGTFRLMLLDASRSFVVRLEKDGFQTIEEPIDPEVGGTLRKEWTLVPGGQEGGGAAATPAEPGALDAPAKARHLYDQGLEAFNASDFATAAARFEEVSALIPESPEPHSGLALSYEKLGDHQKAIAAAKRVLELQPGSTLAYEVMYDAYRALGDADGEATALAGLVEFDPGPETARMIYNAGAALLRQGDPSGAIGRFEQASEMDPSLVPALAALTRLYINAGQLEKAVAAGERAIALQPGHGQVLSALYLAYRTLGQQQKADETFAALREADPQAIGGEFYDLGVNYFNNGDLADATAIFERVLEVLPDHPRAHYMLGLSLISSGDTARGKQMLSRFVELAPDDPEAATARQMIDSL